MAYQFSKKLSTAAATGLMLGAISACGGSPQPAEVPTEPPPAAEPAAPPTDAHAAMPATATEGKACCAGQNECKGKGGCKAGGDCAGKNECKGKGGCNANCPK